MIEIIILSILTITGIIVALWAFNKHNNFREKYESQEIKKAKQQVEEIREHVRTIGRETLKSVQNELDNIKRNIK